MLVILWLLFGGTITNLQSDDFDTRQKPIPHWHLPATTFYIALYGDVQSHYTISTYYKPSWRHILLNTPEYITDLLYLGNTTLPLYHKKEQRVNKDRFVLSNCCHLLGITKDSTSAWEVANYPRSLDNDYIMGYYEIMRGRVIGRPLIYPYDPEGLVLDNLTMPLLKLLRNLKCPTS